MSNVNVDGPDDVTREQSLEREPQVSPASAELRHFGYVHVRNDEHHSIWMLHGADGEGLSGTVMIDPTKPGIDLEKKAENKLDRVVREHAVVESASNDVPNHEFTAPRLGEFLLCCFCSPQKAEELLGDLEEICQRCAAKCGPRAAASLYWWHTVRTIGRYGLRLLSGAALITAILKKLM